jgi:hypothetical protein
MSTTEITRDSRTNRPGDPEAGPLAVAARTTPAQIEPIAATVQCCPPAEQASCCEPAAKASCCGAAATSGGGCGCR